jgi:class 3 adenylate cyclase/CheY-like chemotaxis protein
VTVAPRILVVDDVPANYRLLEAILTPRGYETTPASSGEEALQRLASDRMDLVLLDIMMPGIDGFEVCRRVRSDPATAMLPVIVVTGTASAEKLHAIEAGADDFIPKPVDKDELLARIKSLLRIKRYQDTIAAQATELELQKQALEQRAAQLAELNQTLDQRVRDQVGELDRLGRLKRFLSPQLAELVASSGDASFLESHRREIAVVFCDLRDFTGFAETAEPEEVMGVLAEYHKALGELIYGFEGTLERFAGDGLMVFFNDPKPCDDAALRAVAMAVAMRERVAELARGWHKRGYELEFGVGIAQGYATLGQIGFKERSDYAAIGTVTNLAARLCTKAQGGQILISQRVHSAVENQIETELAGDLDLKGFSKLVRAHNVIALNDVYQR